MNITIWRVMIVLGAALGAATETHAQLFSQPRRPGDPYAYMSNTTASGALNQRVADDFVLTGGGVIDRIIFWGGEYNRLGIYVDIDTIRIEFFAANGAGGIPGTSLYAQDFPVMATNPVATGLPVFGTQTIDMIHNVPLASPFVAAPNTTYWLSISGSGPTVDIANWIWPLSQLVPPANDRLAANYHNGLGWIDVPNNNDCAFVLIPSPGVVAVGLCGLALLGRRCR